MVFRSHMIINDAGTFVVLYRYPAFCSQYLGLSLVYTRSVCRLSIVTTQRPFASVGGVGKIIEAELEVCLGLGVRLDLDLLGG